MALPLIAIAALAGAALGAGKHVSDEKKAKEAQKGVDASKEYDRKVALFSPWTSLAMQNKEDIVGPDLMGNVMGGALSGAGFGQQFGAAESASNLSDAKAGYYHRLGRKGGPAGGPTNEAAASGWGGQ